MSMAATSTPARILDELNAPYSLTESLVRQFRENGFIKLSNVLSPEVITWYQREITDLTYEYDPEKGTKLENKDLYGRAFIQVGNLWEKSAMAAELICCRRLARLATELLGTVGARMYHDQSLYKEGSGGITPWHVDQQYWPMATGNSVTAWIPLQPVPIEMGPLAFGKGSHLRRIGRDLEISEQSERDIRTAVKRNKIVEVFEPFELGDVSFHYGWTLHRAGPNTTDTPRKVQTVIYMDEDMILREPKNENQRRDRDNFSPGIQAGKIMASAKNPVLYSTR
jgi:ectoine hydroxylase-related dioxygenase (phytanoyl-CoA dioxygenase family)